MKILIRLTFNSSQMVSKGWERSSDDYSWMFSLSWASSQITLYNSYRVYNGIVCMFKIFSINHKIFVCCCQGFAEVKSVFYSRKSVMKILSPLCIKLLPSWNSSRNVSGMAKTTRQGPTFCAFKTKTSSWTVFKLDYRTLHPDTFQ